MIDDRWNDEAVWCDRINWAGGFEFASNIMQLYVVFKSWVFIELNPNEFQCFVISLALEIGFRQKIAQAVFRFGNLEIRLPGRKIPRLDPDFAVRVVDLLKARSSICR